MLHAAAGEMEERKVTRLIKDSQSWDSTQMMMMMMTSIPKVGIVPISSILPLLLFLHHKVEGQRKNQTPLGLL